MYAATGGRFAGRHRVRLNTNCLLGRLKSLTEKEDLSFPKIISAHTDDAGRTEWAWRQWFRIAGPVLPENHIRAYL
jgi:hypothetical protein